MGVQRSFVPDVVIGIDLQQIDFEADVDCDSGTECDEFDGCVIRVNGWCVGAGVSRRFLSLVDVFDAVVEFLVDVDASILLTRVSWASRRVRLMAAYHFIDRALGFQQCLHIELSELCANVCKYFVAAMCQFLQAFNCAGVAGSVPILFDLLECVGKETWRSLRHNCFVCKF